MNRNLISMLAFALWAVPVAGQDLSVRDLTARLQQRYEMIDDAVADFTQHVKFGFSNIEQQFRGTLTMKKPNRYRIELEHQTLVTDGVTVWVYSPANNQVLVDRYKENQNSISPEQFLLHLPANYYAAMLGTEAGATPGRYHHTLKLTPKDDRSFVKSAKLWVEDGTWVIRKIAILDVNDTETTYTIQEIRLNTNVADGSFSFEVPASADVVDLRQ